MPLNSLRGTRWAIDRVTTPPTQSYYGGGFKGTVSFKYIDSSGEHDYSLSNPYWLFTYSSSQADRTTMYLGDLTDVYQVTGADWKYDNAWTSIYNAPLVGNLVYVNFSTVSQSGADDEYWINWFETNAILIGGAINVTGRVNVAGAGTVTGSGLYGEGQTYTLRATATGTGWNFSHWIKTRSGQTVSTNAVLNGVIREQDDYDFTAVFIQGTSQYEVIVSKNIAEAGTVTRSGTGHYYIGETFTITATANTGYNFLGWREPRSLNYISTSPTYSDTPGHPDQQMVFEAVFVENNKYYVDVRCPTLAGTVTGAGSYTVGERFQISTQPLYATKYRFMGWRNNETGEIESKLLYYGYYVQTSKYLSYTAVYEKYNYEPSTKEEDLDNNDITDTKPTDWMDHGDTGMYAIFVPSPTQLGNIASWLYSTTFLDGLQQWIDSSILDINLTDIIINLMVLPVTIPTSGTKNIKVGWFSPSSSSGAIAVNYTESNLVELNCGTLKVDGIYNGALDYQTKVEIYLPYIGYESIETYDAIGHDITPIYQVDILTGDCICKIKIDNSFKYQFTGNCAYSIPLSQVNNNGIISKGISGAVSAIGLATGNPMQIASATGALTSNDVNFKGLTSTMGSDVSWANTARIEHRETKATPVQWAKEMIGAFVNMGNGIRHGGSLHGNTGYMAINKPFLNIIRPHVDVPDDFGRLNGFPCNKKLSLGQLNGFTMVDEIRYEGLKCSAEELQELDMLLKKGVVL